MFQVESCSVCGEDVYVGQMDRHMAKDHDPVVDREVELYSACLAAGLTGDQVWDLTDGFTRDQIGAFQDDPCDEVYHRPVRNGLVCLGF